MTPFSLIKVFRVDCLPEATLPYVSFFEALEWHEVGAKPEPHAVRTAKLAIAELDAYLLSVGCVQGERVIIDGTEV